MKNKKKIMKMNTNKNTEKKNNDEEQSTKMENTLKMNENEQSMKMNDRRAYHEVYTVSLISINVSRVTCSINFLFFLFLGLHRIKKFLFKYVGSNCTR